MTRFKFRQERRGEHVHIDVFVTQGESESPTYANAGKMTLRVGEAQVFGAAMCHARDTWTPGHIGVIFDGDVNGPT